MWCRGKNGGRVMLVSSEGYDEEKFRGVYEKIKRKISMGERGCGSINHLP